MQASGSGQDKASMFALGMFRVWACAVPKAEDVRPACCLGCRVSALTIRSRMHLCFYGPQNRCPQPSLIHLLEFEVRGCGSGQSRRRVFCLEAAAPYRWFAKLRRCRILIKSEAEQQIVTLGLLRRKDAKSITVEIYQEVMLRLVPSSCHWQVHRSLDRLEQLLYWRHKRHVATAGSCKPISSVSADDLAACRPPTQYLECLDEMISVARQRPARSGNVQTRRIANEAGNPPCNACGRYFEDSALCKSGSRCKESHCTASAAYYRTLRGNVTKLLSSANWNGKRRDLECSLRRQDVLDMLLEQEGRCAYSGIAMELLVPFSHWRMSLERKNNSDGYMKDNCVLVAAEFNSADFSKSKGVRAHEVQGSAQWSPGKVAAVSNLGAASVSLSQLEADVDRAWSLPQIPFTENYCYLYHRTLRGKAKSLASSAKRRATKRNEQCEIEFGDILRMLLEQGGRCFFSGVPLQYDQVHVDWVMSLERLDNRRGYVQENCVLIAAEFNTTDLSKKATCEVQGSPQWSRAKAMHVWGQAGCQGFSDL